MTNEVALFTNRQAAEYLGYSAGTMQMSRKTGVLAGITAPIYIKFGGGKKSHVRYEKKILNEWIETAKQI